MNQFPKRWDEKRVQLLINHYETQNDDDAVAEDENLLELDTLEKSAKPDSMWAIVKDGRIELINHETLPESAKLLVTLLSDPLPASL